MQKKSDAVTVREYLSARRGLVLAMRGQSVETLWVLVCQLKYHSVYPDEMIEEARRIVLHEQETATN